MNSSIHVDPRPTDVLTLNVGGQGTITISRGTLTQVEGSMLDALFSGRWRLESLDQQGKIYIDHPMILFEPLVDYLRSRVCDMPASETESPTVEDFENDNKLFKKFLVMVNYYGLMETMYPLRIMEANVEAAPSLVEVIPLAYGNSPLKFVTKQTRYFYLQCTSPGVCVASLDVHVQENNTLIRFGWMDPDNLDCRMEHVVQPDSDDFILGFKEDAFPRVSLRMNRKTLDYVRRLPHKQKCRYDFPRVPSHFVPILGGHGSWRICNVVFAPRELEADSMDL